MQEEVAHARKAQDASKAAAQSLRFLLRGYQKEKRDLLQGLCSNALKG
jgi:hypothetical protein